MGSPFVVGVWGQATPISCTSQQRNGEVIFAVSMHFRAARSAARNEGLGLILDSLQREVA